MCIQRSRSKAGSLLREGSQRFLSVMIPLLLFPDIDPALFKRVDQLRVLHVRCPNEDTFLLEVGEVGMPFVRKSIPDQPRVDSCEKMNLIDEEQISFRSRK